MGHEPLHLNRLLLGTMITKNITSSGSWQPLEATLVLLSCVWWLSADTVTRLTLIHSSVAAFVTCEVLSTGLERTQSCFLSVFCSVTWNDWGEDIWVIISQKTTFCVSIPHHLFVWHRNNSSASGWSKTFPDCWHISAKYRESSPWLHCQVLPSLWARAKTPGRWLLLMFASCNSDKFTAKTRFWYPE